MKFCFKMLSLFVLVVLFFITINLNANALEKTVLAPNKLHVGDKICIVESSITENETEKILAETRLSLITKKLQARGFEVLVSKNIFKPSDKLCLGDGTEQTRADLFNEAVKNQEVKAIFAFWGGYGAIHTLNKIDFESFREKKPIFVGFSDETALMVPIFEKSGVITFHGPMVGASINWEQEKTFEVLFNMLMNSKSETELVNIDDNSPFKVFKPGKAEGRVVGGNLWEIQHLMGTPYEIDLTDKILFFEEVNEEEPYRMHAALWQIKLNKNFDKIKGIVIGALTSETGQEEALLNAAFDVFKDVDVPIVYNVHAGHLSNPLTIPIGANLRIDGNKLTITEVVVK